MLLFFCSFEEAERLSGPGRLGRCESPQKRNTNSDTPSTCFNAIDRQVSLTNYSETLYRQIYEVLLRFHLKPVLQQPF